MNIKTNNIKPFIINDGSIEVLKLLALVLMTVDHINRYFFDENIVFAFNIGRIAMPLFGFVLAYNLSRPDAAHSGLYGRIFKKLIFCGLVTTPFYILLGLEVKGIFFGWWPLNIMFTMLISAIVIYLIELKGHVNFAAFFVFLFGGALVEFWWFGILFCICSWMFCKRYDRTSFACMLISCALFYFVNGNFWSLASLPLIIMAYALEIKIERHRYLFYIYYPLHLSIIYFIFIFIQI